MKIKELRDKITSEGGVINIGGDVKAVSSSGDIDFRVVDFKVNGIIVAYIKNRADEDGDIKTGITTIGKLENINHLIKIAQWAGMEVQTGDMQSCTLSCFYLTIRNKKEPVINTI